MNNEQNQDVEILSEEQLETVDAGFGGSISGSSTVAIDLFGIWKQVTSNSGGIWW